MKRQPKPFSVEIKRSRRAPSPSPSAPPAAADESVSSQDKPSRKKRASKPTPEAELVIPAFLKSDKAPSRPTAKSNSQEREDVFAAKTSIRKLERQSPDAEKAPDQRPPARILPSLTSGYGVAPEAAPKPAAKVQGRKAGSGATPKEARTSPRKAKEEAPAARATTTRAEAGSRRKTPTQQSAGPGIELRPARKLAAAVKNDLPTQTKFGQRGQVSRAAQNEAEAPNGEGARRQTKRRSLLKRSRDDFASLPRSEHWKRRIHPRAW